MIRTITQNISTLLFNNLLNTMDNHLFFVLKIEPKRLLRLRSCLKGFPISEKKTKTVQIEVSECKVKGANTIDKNKSQVKHYKLY